MVNIEYTNNFEKIFKIVFEDDILKNNKEITNSMLRAANEYHITEINRLEELTDEICKSIFFRMIWRNSGSELLPYPINLIQFENAIEVTPPLSIKAMQKVINEISGYGVVRSSGYIDVGTSRYIKRYTTNKKDIINFCNIYLDVKEEYFKGLTERKTIYKELLPGRLERNERLKTYIMNYEKETEGEN